VLVLMNGYVTIRIVLIVERQLLLRCIKRQVDVDIEHIQDEILSEIQSLNNRNLKMTFIH
jgi:hypothetical protein